MAVGAETPMWENPETGEKVPRVWASFNDGLIPLSELDDEEVVRCQVRDKNGGWMGAKPKSIHKGIVQAHSQEVLRRHNNMLKEVLLESVAVQMSIMRDEKADPGARLRAAKEIQERFLGKTPDKVELTAEVKPWEGLVQGILTSGDSEASEEAQT